ncbi:DUF7619 domain-containing protein [Flavobacterium terrisoli]|uniref:DUF7619 domain-containing protein n=1 Tax=Flavobacterium terrisoli TaxID=3242195 RepID=UPI002543A39A|nr:T9SS type A sorting domain-containing protein [Flavobacterium buctense]
MRKLFFLIALFSLDHSSFAQIINIPDPVFKSKLLNSTGEFSDANHNNIVVDANQDGEIQLSEALQVHTIYFNNYQPYVTNMTGIEYFANLERLFLESANLTTLDLSGMSNLIQVSYYNNNGQNDLASINLTGLTSLENLQVENCMLTSLDLSGLTNLKYLYCDDNLLTTLNLQGLPNLEILECRNNQLTNLNLSNLTHLRIVHCWYNNLTQMQLNNLPALETLYVTGNELNTLDLSDCNTITFLECSDNLLTSLDVTNLTQLTGVYCSDNLLTTIDVTTNSLLNYLRCENNQLVSLFLKNGHDFVQIQLENNPTLTYICTNDNQVAGFQNYVTNILGYTNCHVNSYCSFTPGGTFYTIQGNNRYDMEGNGCGINDINYPNLKFSIAIGTNIVGMGISNNLGSYSIPLQEGTYTIAPIFETSNYFSVTPTAVTVDFPTDASPFIENFCITPNGIHNDLEVTLLPLGVARPGFDAEYKIIYKNKGTQAQSGSVNLTFNDAVLDLVTSNPIVNSQSTDNLSWDFSNLLPFETREILVTLNINSPMEIPAVNSGDILNYTTAITAATDETPNDNTSVLNQTVFNSFDPNDKTCLEGTTITPSMVGEYVHYVIRFENTGTFPAENIVVKDMIDTTRFDITSLIPQSGSHQFVTRITNTNQVEFIFENINLPFDDATNDGYVAFKIKTKPTLVIGDTFSNSANIYFDYNFPIVTNTATTTVQALATQDFDFSVYFSVYPNPADTVLNLKAQSEIGVKSINIYNALGQIVMAIPNAESVSTIDVSDIQSGTYFIKVNTDKGTANTKFIKK